MLHELLFSLYGCSQHMPSGNLLCATNVSQEEQERTTVQKFEEYYSFMHPSEKEIGMKIFKIAISYKKIEVFSDFYRFYQSYDLATDGSKLLQGQYISAFATAVYEETMPYKSEIVNLEEKILKFPNVSLSTILLSIQPFSTTFSQFGYLIDVIQSERRHGCKILELIHQHVKSTVGYYHEALIRVEKVVLQVLYDQLSYWLLYGELLDSHHELFLKPFSGDNLHCDKSSNSGISEMDQECGSRNISMDVALDISMVPDFIDLDIAEKILFIGESVRFYEKDGKINADDLMSTSVHILQQKKKEFFICFSKLGNKDGFCMREFTELVEAIRKCVSEHLYTLVMDAGLPIEFRNLKEIFLLGRGELYHSFFALVEKFVLKQSRCMSKREFNILFQKAGRQVLLEDDFLEKFTLTYHGSSELENRFAWNNFKIDYIVQWPFHKIFNPSIMEKYNTILRFLFNVQRTQYRLQHLWVIQKEKKGIKMKDNDELLCWTLRHHMSHLIYNFQYYIQVDVLESFYWQLMKETTVTKDYQRLSLAHSSFLASVMTHCFLSHPLLCSSITAILDQVHIFCSLLEGSNLGPSKEEVDKIREDFDRVSAKFFWGLTVLGQQRSSHYMAQLVTRIDYNHYYSRKSSAKRFMNVDITLQSK